MARDCHEMLYFNCPHQYLRCFVKPLETSASEVRICEENQCMTRNVSACHETELRNKAQEQNNSRNRE